MKIISRKEAKALGLKRYFTGKLCKRGHLRERLVSTLTCVECGSIASLSHKRAHPERVKAAQAERRAATREKYAAYNAKYRAANHEKCIAGDRLRREKNLERYRKSSRDYHRKLRVLLTIARQIIPEIVKDIGL